MLDRPYNPYTFRLLSAYFNALLPFLQPCLKSQGHFNLKLYVFYQGIAVPFPRVVGPVSVLDQRCQRETGVIEGQWNSLALFVQGELEDKLLDRLASGRIFDEDDIFHEIGRASCRERV